MSSYEPYAGVSTGELGNMLRKTIKKLQRIGFKKRAGGGDQRAQEPLAGARGTGAAVRKDPKPTGKRKRVDDEDEEFDVAKGEQKQEPTKITEKVDGILRSNRKQKEKNQDRDLDMEVGIPRSDGVPSAGHDHFAAQTIQPEINLLLDRENIDASAPEHLEAAEDITPDQVPLRQETSKADVSIPSKQAADPAEAAKKDGSFQDAVHARSNNHQETGLTQNDRGGAIEEQANASTVTFSSSDWALRAARIKLLEEQAERLWQELVELQREGSKAM